jgi:GT2 family glycosyltransferase
MADPIRINAPENIISRAGRLLTRMTSSENGRYQRWLTRHSVDTVGVQNRLKALPEHPIFTIFVWCSPDQNSQLGGTLESLRNQVYQDMEIVIIGPVTKDIGQEKLHDARFISPDRAHKALQSIKGHYLLLISAGDAIPSHALVSLAEMIIDGHEPDLIYSDEDMLDRKGKRGDPIFKPDWSPDLLLTQYYLGNLAAFRRKAVMTCGGIDWSLGEAAAHDLALRLTEKYTNIAHIPDILFNKLAGENQPSDPQVTASILRRAIERRNLPVRFSADNRFPGLFIPHWSSRNHPLVSVIILNKDKPDYLADCLDSVFRKTSYPNYEVIVVDNGSLDQRTDQIYKQWQSAEPGRFRIMEDAGLFNFSRLNNQAAKKVKGKLLLFLNNDICLISPDWLDEMAGQAVRPDIGAVGCMLQFPDGTIQHAGIIRSQPLNALHTHYRFPATARGHLGRLRVPSECSMVTGACLMIQKQKFHSIGGFDEDLPVAYNDADLCLRLLKQGYRNLILPQVQLIHYESVTRGSDEKPGNRMHFSRDQQHFQEKWTSLQIDPYYNPNFNQARGDYTLPV